MPTCNKTLYTLNEYGRFSCDVAASGYIALPKETFDALEEFILINNSDADVEAQDLLKISSRPRMGKIITACNYVGLITMTDGTVIEILPKIAGKGVSQEETKKIFLEMLKTLKDVKFKNHNISNLRTDRLSLFEIFIKMFLDEIVALTKQGIKSAYTPIESNERFYKGKLLASQNIKYNLVNKERFFVEYDEFSPNRPENRLIKSALGLLLKLTTDAKNRQLAMKLLAHFEGIDYSSNYDVDFSKCISDRSMSHYDKALSWCRIFLKGNSFTAYSGSSVAVALLFPMETVFESYIAAKLYKAITPDIKMVPQDSKYSLFDQPRRAFGLKPDIVLHSRDTTVVLDTKWKLLSAGPSNSGISQSDMYQMYAYGKKYQAERVVLIYPFTEDVGKIRTEYTSKDGVRVAIKFVDLRDPDTSIKQLLSEITESAHMATA